MIGQLTTTISMAAIRKPLVYAALLVLTSAFTSASIGPNKGGNHGGKPWNTLSIFSGLGGDDKNSTLPPGAVHSPMVPIHTSEGDEGDDQDYKPVSGGRPDIEELAKQMMESISKQLTDELLMRGEEWDYEGSDHMTTQKSASLVPGMGDASSLTINIRNTANSGGSDTESHQGNEEEGEDTAEQQQSMDMFRHMWMLKEMLPRKERGCPAGFVEAADNCFLLSDMCTTRANALRYCQAFDSHLVALDHPRINYQVMYLLHTHNRTNDTFWTSGITTGIPEEADNMYWETKGERVGYAKLDNMHISEEEKKFWNERPSQPSQGFKSYLQRPPLNMHDICVTLAPEPGREGHMWQDKPCYHTRANFICQHAKQGQEAPPEPTYGPLQQASHAVESMAKSSMDELMGHMTQYVTGMLSGQGGSGSNIVDMIEEQVKSVFQSIIGGSQGETGEATWEGPAGSGHENGHGSGYGSRSNYGSEWMGEWSGSGKHDSMQNDSMQTGGDELPRYTADYADEHYPQPDVIDHAGKNRG